MKRILFVAEAVTLAQVVRLVTLARALDPARYEVPFASARFDVVSNGGSTTGYQALAAGRPVLGIPFNLDQYLACQAIERAGAGLVVRAGLAEAPRGIL